MDRGSKEGKKIYMLSSPAGDPSQRGCSIKEATEAAAAKGPSTMITEAAVAWTDTAATRESGVATT